MHILLAKAKIRHREEPEELCLSMNLPCWHSSVTWLLNDKLITTIKVVAFTCWLGGVAWGVCPVGGACPPLLSTTGMLGDVVLWWGLNESCQSTAFLFNTHTLLIPPQPVSTRETHQSHFNNSTVDDNSEYTIYLKGTKNSEHRGWGRWNTQGCVNDGIFNFFSIVNHLSFYKKILYQTFVGGA